MSSSVSVRAPVLPAQEQTPPWETVLDRSGLPLDAIDCACDPAAIRTGAELTAYAAQSFASGRPLLEAVIDLTRRIHEDFTFDTRATPIGTSVAEVFESRRGVCQDFARLEIACLRVPGLPAHHVSGYIETTAPPDATPLLGAAVSHAWLAVYCPGVGWIDVDPTNNLLPSGRHITLGWGRDYGDVSPIRGVVILGGGSHSLQVAVEVSRVE